LVEKPLLLLVDKELLLSDYYHQEKPGKFYGNAEINTVSISRITIPY
jgi:hypothetical protein